MAFVDRLDEGLTQLKMELNRANQKSKTAKTDVKAEAYRQEAIEIADEIRRVEQYRRDYGRNKTTGVDQPD